MALALIASALYVATYLSFTYLLRYPRNWFQPSLTASLLTGGLAVLTVLLASWSFAGFDLLVLSVTLSFLVVLLFIIAAPAIAFKPAPQLVEFLAKHSDHAGLWLFVPAVVAGLVISDVEFYAILATAMAIELARFLHQQWANRQRRLLPLGDNDLAVLKTQASGDLPAFKRRHNIRELILSEGAVSWNGCGKTTPPCPFNLYVNRLGLNTAPCCREHMKELTHHATACLVDIGAVHWLEGGSLLGAVRENGELLDWEDDVDISVLLDSKMTWKRLASGLAECGAREGFFVDIFEDKEFISMSYDPPKRWPFRWERNRLRGEIRADIATYRQATSHTETVLERRSYKGAMPATENGGYGMPIDIILPTSTILFLGSQCACPSDAKAYLHLMYGDFEKIEYTYLDTAAAETRAVIAATTDPSIR